MDIANAIIIVKGIGYLRVLSQYWLSLWAERVCLHLRQESVQPQYVAGAFHGSV